MATKDITDLQVLQAYDDSKKTGYSIGWPEDLLQQRTGQPEKVCACAVERAVGRGLIDYGVTLRSGWLTEKGASLLSNIQ
ncbi:MAG TPA: hypothetical protein VIK56_08775 [Rhodoferax sp.]